jgi:hypothetical protein
MGVIALNGVSPKMARPIAGQIFESELAATQHDTTTVGGTSYAAPLTSSGKSVFPEGRTMSTQPHLAALAMETPGHVVKVHKVVRVAPHEKGSHFSGTHPGRPVVGRAMGPSPHADTAHSPNAPSLKQTTRPIRRPYTPPPSNHTLMSFHRSGGTIGAHADPQAGTSSGVSRWATVKKGAVPA